MEKIKGIIFDLDGTLVSSSLNFAQMKQQLNCPAQQDLLQYVDSLQGQDKQNALAYIHGQEMIDASTSHVLPGVTDLLQHIQQNNLPHAIVTRNILQAARLKLKNNQLNIDHVICREQAPPKPDPSALLQLAKQWQLPAKRIMYVGDYKYDVQAANAAGMVSVLYWGKEKAQPLPDYAAQAQLVIEHMDELIKYL